MSEIKELAIGEEGIIDGVKVRCVEHEDGTLDCPKCVFKDADLCGRKNKCQSIIRFDGVEVYFVAVES